MTDSNTIDLGGLLTIDVASELRKLAGAQIQGPWQIPAELVRRALRASARTVDVRIERSGVIVSDDGGPIPPRMLEWTATLLDERRSNADRHQALTALEEHGGLVFLVIAGLRPKYLRVATRSASEEVVLEWGASGTAKLSRTRTSSPPGTEVGLRAPSLDRRQIDQWLNNVCRFAPGQIRVDGKKIPHGFERAAVHGALNGPLRGRIAIPTEGETAHVWLLEHGLVSGHLTVPDAPCFEAAVELGSAATDLNPARLREQVTPHVAALVERAAGLLATLGQRSSALPEKLRARTARLLLAALRKRVAVERLITVPIFRVVDGGGSGFADLAELKEACQRSPTGVRTLTALYPSQKAERFALGSSKVLVADTTERCRLAELINVRFRPPDSRDTAGSLSAMVKRGLDAMGRGLGRVGSRLRHPLTSSPLPDGMLESAELNLISGLREHICEGPRNDVRDCFIAKGGGPIRTSDGQLLLPRSNPTVRAAVRAVHHDPKWLYPAALALLDGRGLPSSKARARWLSG